MDEKGKQDYKDVIQTLMNLQSKEVNVVTILGYATTQDGTKYDSGAQFSKGYIVQPKAQGSEMYSSDYGSDMSRIDALELKDRIKTFETAPQEHFDK